MRRRKLKAKGDKRANQSQKDKYSSQVRDSAEKARLNGGIRLCRLRLLRS
jgi:hypothetical protein